MYILGLSGLLIDGAAHLLKEGEVVAAIEEERPVRFKQASMKLSGGFPEPAVVLCRRPADLSLPEMPRAPLPKPIPPSQSKLWAKVSNAQTNPSPKLLILARQGLG